MSVEIGSEGENMSILHEHTGCAGNAWVQLQEKQITRAQRAHNSSAGNSNPLLGDPAPFTGCEQCRPAIDLRHRALGTEWRH
jgi:hypothetical protein